MRCVYKERNNNTCGLDCNCKGCSHDPNNSSMSFEEFLDGNYHWNCNSCIYCNPGADRDGVESTCKRLDHKHYSFAKAIFYSYDCGHRNGCLCKDYEPKENHVWLFNHYKKEFLEDFINMKKPTATMSLCIDHDWEVRYEVLYSDFVNNTFLDENGNLKWIRKGYYKQSRKSSTGWIYVYEYPDGTIQEGANDPILWDKVENMNIKDGE